MAATTGTVSAKGVTTGQMYHIDAYVPDAVASVWTFDGGGGAGSGTQTFYSFPEPVIIEDISMAAAPTATRGRITANNVPTASCIRYGNHLYSLNNRPYIGVKLKAGTQLGILNL